MPAVADALVTICMACICSDCRLQHGLIPHGARCSVIVCSLCNKAVGRGNGACAQAMHGPFLQLSVHDVKLLLSDGANAVQDGAGPILQQYRGPIHAVRKIAAQEGWRAFYKGLTPAIIGSGAYESTVKPRLIGALHYKQHKARAGPLPVWQLVH